MDIGKIVQYGLYDSKNQYSTLKTSPKRKITTFEFDYIISCDEAATSYINDNSAKLMPNMLIVRKPGQISNSTLHFKCYCLHLDIEKTNPLYSELISTPDYYPLINDKTYQPLFETLLRHLIKHSSLQKSLVIEAFATPDYFVWAKILELIYNLKKDEIRNTNAIQSGVKKENRSIQKAISYMKHHCDEDITLEKLGALTGYSPNYFQHVFSNIMNVSPQKYLESIRIEHAKFLLVQNEKSLSDISYACGFSSQSYFSKVFKRYTLLSPLDFRRRSQFRYFV